MVNYTMLFSLRLFYFWSLFSHYYNLELQYNKVHSSRQILDEKTTIVNGALSVVRK